MPVEAFRGRFSPAVPDTGLARTTRLFLKKRPDRPELNSPMWRSGNPKGATARLFLYGNTKKTTSGVIL